MKRLLTVLALLLVIWIHSDAQASGQTPANATQSQFPQVVRIRLWYLHPPHELKLRADAGRANTQSCHTCQASPLTTLTVRASGSSIQSDAAHAASPQLRISGVYQMTAADSPPIHADFPIEVRADQDRLVITAYMPMEEYI